MGARPLTTALTPPQLHAARYVVARVRAEVRADLVQASLFGSRARGDARADSDVDLLLVFRSLPPDREPYATQAEEIAEEEAHRSRVPVTVWSVSLLDLALGNRTPMLVDALADAIPLWCSGDPLPHVPFTPRDAVHCVDALLRRTAEGSDAVRYLLGRGELPAALLRVRDDLVRLCTAHLLLSGITRPRRGEAARACVDRFDPPPHVRSVLRWVERSFGSNGTEERAGVPHPPGSVAELAHVAETLRRAALHRRSALRQSIDAPRRLVKAVPAGNGPCASTDD